MNNNITIIVVILYRYSLDLSNYIKSESLDMPPDTPPTEALAMCVLPSSEEDPITCYLTSPCTSVCKDSAGGICPDPSQIAHSTTPDADNQQCYVFLHGEQVYYQMNCYQVQQASHCTYYFTVTPSNILAMRGLILAVAFITLFWFIGELVLWSVERSINKEEEQGLARMSTDLPPKRKYLRDQIRQRWAEEAEHNYSLLSPSIYDNTIQASDDYYYNNTHHNHIINGSSSTSSHHRGHDNKNTSRDKTYRGGGTNHRASSYHHHHHPGDGSSRSNTSHNNRRMMKYNEVVGGGGGDDDDGTLLLTLFYILLIICSQFLVIYFSPQNAQPLTSIVSAFVGVVSIWRATSWLDWIIFVDVLLDVVLFIAAAIVVKWPTQGVFANRLQAELRGDKSSKEGRNDDGVGYYDDEEEEEDGSITEGRSMQSYDYDVEGRPYHHRIDDDSYYHDVNPLEAHSYNGKRRAYYQHSYDGDDDDDLDGNNRGRRYDSRVRPRYPSLTERRLQQLNERSDDSTPYAARVLEQQHHHNHRNHQQHQQDQQDQYNHAITNFGAAGGDDEVPREDSYDVEDEDSGGDLSSLISSSSGIDGGVTSTLPSSEDTATVDFVLSQGMTRDVCLMIACHNSTMTLERLENHLNMLRAALSLFPPSHIFVCDNGSSLQPPDENIWACEQVHPDINYLYIPEGNKTFAFYWCNKYWIPFLQQNDRIPSFKYAVIIDDDVILPSDLHIPHQLLDQCPEIKAVHFPIGATTPPAASGMGSAIMSNVLVGCQDCEYRLAAVHKQFQATLATATSCHGAVALWDRETLDEVLYDHDTVFHGEDLQMGINLLRKRDNSRIISSAQSLIPTYAPDTW
ncbi:hypothetical protein FOZ60_017253 [Perkinsus olseni]|uniref:Uncharacterized protein n=1 Tax=Perkinsus olseni TaxID=32597 RepID=A0A7J6P438_PEROL|nr:hypothetical protein FOZ60_017253 [Perkinsus olseni]